LEEEEEEDMSEAVPTTLDDLVQRILNILGDKGLNELSEEEVASLKTTMENYKSNPNDWKKYAMFDPMKYTRNLVSNGNGKFNLIVLCWGSGHQSAIHDHAGSHCILKMLDGELKETQYYWPETEGKSLEVKQETVMHRDETAYMHDKIGLHRVANEHHVKGAISLHLYTPPYSECKSYDERSGTARRAGNITFYSIDGQKIKN